MGVSVRERVGRGRAASEHSVHFFDSDDNRVEAVSSYLADAYGEDSSLLVVARPLTWAAISERLQRFGVPIQQAAASGRLVALDVRETLNRISRHGTPDATLFDSVVRGMVTRLAAHRRVAIYGEMVDLLAQRGDVDDAVLLEAFWNRLASRVPMSLLCGYSAAHFVAAGTHRALRDICAAHSDVHADESDPLAMWLLNTAHHSAPTLHH